MATPILDEAIRQYCNLQEIGYTDVRVLVADVLRAALPWDLPAEAIEAMRDAIWSCDAESAWDSIASADCRKAALAAYRAQPVLKELYPEKFTEEAEQFR